MSIKQIKSVVQPKTKEGGDTSQGNLIQGEGSDSLKTALETKGKTA